MVTRIKKVQVFATNSHGKKHLFCEARTLSEAAGKIHAFDVRQSCFYNSLYLRRRAVNRSIQRNEIPLFFVMGNGATCIKFYDFSKYANGTSLENRIFRKLEINIIRK